MAEGDFEVFVRDQVSYMRDHFEGLEDKLDAHIDEDKKLQIANNSRLTALEKAKIYFDGQKSGATLTIGATITAIVGAAIYIISKMNPGQ
jgi:hypothetical protein